MQVHVFTLRFNPVTERFDDSGVAGFLADKDVLSIHDHFFVKDDVPYLVLVVRYRAAVLPAPATTAKAEQSRDDSWRELLTEADLPLFETLRAWRSERCKQEGIWNNAPPTATRRIATNVATDTYPLHKCLDDVAASDVYVGLVVLGMWLLQCDEWQGNR